MKERILNIFLFVCDENGQQEIRGLGCKVHVLDGSDAEKMAFLQKQVPNDYRECKRFPLPHWCWTIRDGVSHAQSLSYPGWHSLDAATRIEILEPMFQAIKAPRDPVICITPIVNGQPLIDEIVDLDLKPIGG